MNIINTREALEQAKAATEKIEQAHSAYEIKRAEREMELARLLLLASIAQSLDNINKNGIMVEKP